MATGYQAMGYRDVPSDGWRMWGSLKSTGRWRKTQAEIRKSACRPQHRLKRGEAFRTVPALDFSEVKSGAVIPVQFRCIAD
jgi:hypothetical protein